MTTRRRAKSALRVAGLGCADVGMPARKSSHIARGGGSRNRELPGSQSYSERKVSQRYSKLRKRMAAATTQAMADVAREFANSPILRRFPVNWMSGITAKGSG